MLCELNPDEICFERMVLRFFLISFERGDSGTGGAGGGGGTTVSPSVWIDGFNFGALRFGCGLGFAIGGADAPASLEVGGFGAGGFGGGGFGADAPASLGAGDVVPVFPSEVATNGHRCRT